MYVQYIYYVHTYSTYICICTQLHIRSILNIWRDNIALYWQENWEDEDEEQEKKDVEKQDETQTSTQPPKKTKKNLTRKIEEKEVNKCPMLK
jgi:hypothetical protein